MKRRVAQLPDFVGTPLAIVEVSRAEVAHQTAGEQLLKQFAELPQFQGARVLLGVPHEGQLVAAFAPTTEKEQLVLAKIGWLRLGFQEVELPPSI
jgi:hypothetical protein